MGPTGHRHQERLSLQALFGVSSKQNTADCDRRGWSRRGSLEAVNAALSIAKACQRQGKELPVAGWRVGLRLASRANDVACTGMSRTPTGQMECLLVVYRPLQRGRVGRMVAEQPACKGRILFRELISAIRTERIVWETGQQAAPEPRGQRLIPELASGAGLLHQHRRCHGRPPPALPLKQPLPAVR